MAFIPDCNNCTWITLTEYEQRMLDKTLPHICQAYHVRLLHITNERDHIAYICPCDQCIKDKHKMFIDVNDKNI